MSAWQHINKKQLAFLLFIIAAIAIGSKLRNINSSGSDDTVRQLDEQLLQDLVQRPLSYSDSTECVMQCAGITEQDLKQLFSTRNLDYDNCDFGNCHITTYTLEGELRSGKHVSFRVSTGEDGDKLDQLIVEEECSC